MSRHMELTDEEIIEHCLNRAALNVATRNQKQHGRLLSRKPPLTPAQSHSMTDSQISMYMILAFHEHVEP